MGTIFPEPQPSKKTDELKALLKQKHKPNGTNGTNGAISHKPQTPTPPKKQEPVSIVKNRNMVDFLARPKIKIMVVEVKGTGTMTEKHYVAYNDRQSFSAMSDFLGQYKPSDVKEMKVIVATDMIDYIKETEDLDDITVDETRKPPRCYEADDERWSMGNGGTDMSMVGYLVFSVALAMLIAIGLDKGYFNGLGF